MKRQISGVGAINSTIQQGQGVDGSDTGYDGVLSGSGLQHDGVRSLGHGVDVRMLEGRDPRIVREGVKESNLVEGPDIRKEGYHVVKELGRKPIANGTSLASLTGVLTRSTAKMTEKGLPGSGVRGDTRGPNDGVDGGASGWGEDRKKCVKATPLRGVEMR